jgi:carboxylesterase type B
MENSCTVTVATGALAGTKVGAVEVLKGIGCGRRATPYYFSYVSSAAGCGVPGAQHGAEIPFVFGSWSDVFNCPASSEDHAMATFMHECWIAFAKTGKPACDSEAWPATRHRRASSWNSEGSRSQSWSPKVPV